MKHTLLFLLIFLPILVNAQEKIKIDHTAYDKWNSISAVQQSRTGKIVAYEINPQVGDGTLYIKSLTTDKEKSFIRATDASISYEENQVVFFIQTGFDSIRELKLKKVKESDFPNDTLAIYYVAEDSLEKIADVDSYLLSEKGQWLAYLSKNDERDVCPEKKCRIFKRKNRCERPETNGSTLHIRNLQNDNHLTYHQIVEYYLSEKGTELYLLRSLKGEEDSITLHYLNLETGQEKSILSNQLAIQKIAHSDDFKQLAFLATNDTNKLKNYDLFYWDHSQSQAERIVDSMKTAMPKGQTVSIYQKPYFSEDGTKLFFGTAPIVRQEPEDTLLDSEKAVVDVWNGWDQRIQPQQLHEKKRDERNSFLAMYKIADKMIMPIEDDSLTNFRWTAKGNGKYGLLYNYNPYQRANNWEFPWSKDVYIVNLESGERTLLRTDIAYGNSLSPSGENYIFYAGKDSAWMGHTIGSGKTINLTKQFEALFADDNNGNPFVPFSQGSWGWTKIDNDEYYIVNSQFDIWALNPAEPNKSFSITSQTGKQDNIKYRYINFDRDSLYTDLATAIIHGQDKTSKDELYAKLTFDQENASPSLETLIQSNHSFIFVDKADDSDAILFRRMNFIDYPEIESTNLSFNEISTLSATNPQQSTYNWGTVELVHWKTFNGHQMDGLLYKPENFDSTASYPMIVYFYEKYSDNIHNHYPPRPTASIVYPTEYVSNGYIIFIPDIVYTPGHPAKSAYDCIVSGTDYLTSTYDWIDTNRLGLQGQSWGGYQTAQLITMTTKYQAAMAGAPVSNMFSAYGGIRWGSGLSRMFQYERTQSRIGYTIWEKPELYIENSPIFGLPNVTTPLLIMHNDGDGAVPWYQGIELYMGMRRLDKPVWMLNYNGDEHNLMQRANRVDLSIRMRQFFDHYLLGEDPPVWMIDGVPAVDKGKTYGLDIKKQK